MTGMAVLQYGNLCIDPNQRRVYVNEQVVELTTMEFNILYYSVSCKFKIRHLHIEKNRQCLRACSGLCEAPEQGPASWLFMRTNRLLL